MPKFEDKPIDGEFCPYAYQECRKARDQQCPIKKTDGWQEFKKGAERAAQCQYKGDTLSFAAYTRGFKKVKANPDDDTDRS